MPIYNNYTRSTHSKDMREAARTLSRYRRAPEMITIMAVGHANTGKSTYLQSFCDTFSKARLKSESLDDTPIVANNNTKDDKSSINTSGNTNNDYASFDSSSYHPSNSNNTGRGRRYTNDIDNIGGTGIKRDMHCLFDVTSPTKSLTSRTLLVKDQITGNKRHIKFIDTPGFEPDSPEKTQRIVKQIVDHIEWQYDRHLREELKVRRQRHSTVQMVHVILYFVSPPMLNADNISRRNGGGGKIRSATDLFSRDDIEVMTQLSKRANVIPVIGKSDTLSLADRKIIQNGKLFSKLAKEYPDLKLYNFNVNPDIEEPETPGGMLKPMNPTITDQSGNTNTEGNNGGANADGASVINSAVDGDDGYRYSENRNINGYDRNDDDDEEVASRLKQERMSLLDATRDPNDDLPPSLQNALLKQTPFLLVGSEHVSEYQNALLDMVEYNTTDFNLQLMRREYLDKPRGLEDSNLDPNVSDDAGSPAAAARHLGKLQMQANNGVNSRSNSPSSAASSSPRSRIPSRKFMSRSGTPGWRPKSRVIFDGHNPADVLEPNVPSDGPNMTIERNGYKENVFLGRKFAYGEIHLMNPEHADFALLRAILIDSHLQSLRDWTLEFHYENYRTYVMCQNPQISENPEAMATLSAIGMEKANRRSMRRSLSVKRPAQFQKIKDNNNQRISRMMMMASGANTGGGGGGKNQNLFYTASNNDDGKSHTSSKKQGASSAASISDNNSHSAYSNLNFSENNEEFNRQLNENYNFKHKYKQYHPVGPRSGRSSSGSADESNSGGSVRASPQTQAKSVSPKMSAAPAASEGHLFTSKKSKQAGSGKNTPLYGSPNGSSTGLNQRSFEKPKAKNLLESFTGSLLKHRNKHK
ncbi:cell division control protein [Mycoemilia scoparia]|uniref:Cell division control protein n=1 Tax=Mycoemilia scoparia TaxID=417184 RepID=A0A9W7ZSI7_9FUNG|nr:cell division control protein [Mycoemilia scoparia]